MDFFQRWKALHYYVRDAFSPLMLSVRQHPKNLEIKVVSDKIQTDSLTLNIELIDFDGNLLHSRKIPFSTPSNTSKELALIPINELILKGINVNHVLLCLSAADEKGKIHARDLHYFTSVKNLDLPKNHGLSFNVEHQGLVYVIKLSSQKLAKNVYLDFPEVEGFFSKN